MVRPNAPLMTLDVFAFRYFENEGLMVAVEMWLENLRSIGSGGGPGGLKETIQTLLLI